MPIHEGRDSSGGYFQWGYHRGHKYYYGNIHGMTKDQAYHHALAQAQAAYAEAERQGTTVHHSGRH